MQATLARWSPLVSSLQPSGDISDKIDNSRITNLPLPRLADISQVLSNLGQQARSVFTPLHQVDANLLVLALIKQLLNSW